MNPEDNYPADLGMVPTGTKCGSNMVRKLPILLLAVSISNTSMHFQLNVLTMSYLSAQVCYNQRCQDIRNIKVYGTSECSAKCNNHGVRNVLTLQYFGAQ